jgi:hypothetical protein
VGFTWWKDHENLFFPLFSHDTCWVSWKNGEKKEGGHFKKCNALHFSKHPPPAVAK